MRDSKRNHHFAILTDFATTHLPSLNASAQPFNSIRSKGGNDTIQHQWQFPQCTTSVIRYQYENSKTDHWGAEYSGIPVQTRLLNHLIRVQLCHMVSGKLGISTEYPIGRQESVVSICSALRDKCTWVKPFKESSTASQDDHAIVKSHFGPLMVGNRLVEQNDVLDYRQFIYKNGDSVQQLPNKQSNSRIYPYFPSLPEPLVCLTNATGCVNA